MHIDNAVRPADLEPQVARFFELAGPKLLALDARWRPDDGAPVFTVAGHYTARGWTEWTQGFQFGMPLLQFDATGDERFLGLGRARTLERMAPHLTATGVHDHGFNNVSTYGALRRLALEDRSDDGPDRRAFYDLALMLSGAVQAARWTPIADGTGFIHSFNGPHSLFVDTARSCRSLALAHHLGHVLMGEGDRPISLLGRAVEHLRATARYNVYYGEGRDAYDVAGRVAHESIFNTTDGRYRCPSTQQGYSPFSTWTRGLAWMVAACGEQLEWLATVNDGELEPLGGRDDVEGMLARAGVATAEFYIEHTAADGIPYWDTGAPGLARMGDWRDRPGEPDNPHEPVDSSAAAITAQGLLRLGRWLGNDGARYTQAGLTVARTLFTQPYVSERPDHEGLLLHTIYHRPNGWDHVPPGAQAPRGESCMWGDYHAMELALMVLRMARGEAWPTFFGPAA